MVGAELGVDVIHVDSVVKAVSRDRCFDRGQTSRAGTWLKTLKRRIIGWQHSSLKSDLHRRRRSTLDSGVIGADQGIGLANFGSDRRQGVISAAVRKVVFPGGQFDLNLTKLAVEVLVLRAVGERVVVGAVFHRARNGLLEPVGFVK